MECPNNKIFSTQYLISWAILIVVFSYMLVLNMLMPMHRDDYGYALIWGTLNKIASWPDVFQSLYNHYIDHGGRMVAYFVLDSFLFLGKQWYNPFNAFLFVALIMLIHWHSQRKITLHFDPYVILCIVLFTWLGLPHFAEVNLWMAGATGYLFTAVLILTFLLPYHFAFLNKNVLKDNFFAIIGMFLGGIIAGWTIENTSATMSFLITCSAFYFYKKNAVQKWMLSGLVGAITGLALLVLAPGNYVRYAGTKKAIILHFTNLIAAGVETLFYILPIILFLLFIWRVLLINYAKNNAVFLQKPQGTINRLTLPSILTLIFIVFMLVSYINNNFFSNWLGNLLYNNVAIPLGIAKPHLKEQLFNVMSGFEEMVIYLLIILQLFSYIFKKSHLSKKETKFISNSVSIKQMMISYPALYHAAAWIAVAVFNHFVMVASPSFPARASYGSVVFLIIGAVSVFTIPEVYDYLLNDVARKKSLVICSVTILIPMAIAVLNQYSIIFHEDRQRISYIEEMASQGIKNIEVEPISSKNRVLRHVYFVDFDNKVSRSHVCDYYKLENITLKK